MSLLVPQILKTAAEKIGFRRVRYSENKMPTTISNVTVFLFLGDIRSAFVLSSLLLRRFQEESRGSRYFILCSWPGNEPLFPYVDEYWEITDETHVRSIYNQTNGFENKSDGFTGYQRLLNSYFEEVIDYSVLEEFYKDGFQQEFFERYKHIKRFLPSVPSSAILGLDFNRRMQHGKKVFIYPAVYIQDWRSGRSESLITSNSFWEALVERLLKEEFMPVVWQNAYTHDLSPKFLDKCVYLPERNLSHVMAGMRATGCVLDLFTGISRLAIGARCPYLICKDRNLYNSQKEYEIDILCGKGIPRDNFYIFPSICDDFNKPYWNPGLFDGIIKKLTSLIEDTNRDDWPSPTELYDIVAYEPARKVKTKKLGTHFIKVPKY